MNDMDWEFNIDKIINDFKYEPVYDIYIAIENLLLADDEYQKFRLSIHCVFDCCIKYYLKKFGIKLSFSF